MDVQVGLVSINDFFFVTGQRRLLTGLKTLLRILCVTEPELRQSNLFQIFFFPFFLLDRV